MRVFERGRKPYARLAILWDRLAMRKCVRRSVADMQREVLSSKGPMPSADAEWVGGCRRITIDSADAGLTQV